MVLLETLRLYTPVLTMQRKPISDIRLESFSIPKGTEIIIPIPILHRDKKGLGWKCQWVWSVKVWEWDHKCSKDTTSSSIILNRTKVMHRSELCNVGSKVSDGHDPAEILLHTFPKVCACTNKSYNTSTEVRSSHSFEATGCIIMLDDSVCILWSWIMMCK